eukprot:TRINITY_DN2827_c0_g1_i4.p1 TRINITY_DN2827_c0_g1~~TRINITY_DN2827_c0_g1_i4.p1  ORF type:complete len:1180 (-),score=319.58 TRINITY_DN2827_c0_g1_i4:216-3308(-)
MDTTQESMDVDVSSQPDHTVSNPTQDVPATSTATTVEDAPTAKTTSPQPNVETSSQATNNSSSNNDNSNTFSSRFSMDKFVESVPIPPPSSSTTTAPLSSTTSTTTTKSVMPLVVASTLAMPPSVALASASPATTAETTAAATTGPSTTTATSVPGISKNISPTPPPPRPIVSSPVRTSTPSPLGMINQAPVTPSNQPHSVAASIPSAVLNSQVMSTPLSRTLTPTIASTPNTPIAQTSSGLAVKSGAAMPPLPPGVLTTPTSVGLKPLPGPLISKMPLPPEALSSSAANNIPLPPGILTSGPPPGVLKPSVPSSMPPHPTPLPPPPQTVLPEGIRPMPITTSKVQQPVNNVLNPILPQKPDPSVVADPTLTDPAAMQAVLAYLRKYNLGDTETMLKEEMKKREVAKPSIVQQQPTSETEVGNVLAKYKSDGDPNSYEAAYSDLERFIENSLDQHKHELALILYPVFVHMYLELVYNQHEAQAVQFMYKYAPSQESYYQEDIKKLSFVKKREHMAGNELIDNFKTSLFTVRMSRDTYQQLRDHKKKNNEKHHTLLWNLIHDHLFLDMYEGHARSKAQIDSTAGAVVGEAQRQANRAKVYYGLPREPDIQFPTTTQEEEEEPTEGTAADGDKPKKKKKKDIFIPRKSKTDPNAPVATRMPFPDLRDSDKLEKGKALRESIKRANLGPNNIPSICMYTLMNVCNQVTCLAVTDDSSMLAAGLSDSKIKVWSLLNHKLKKLKSASALQDINREAEDVLHRMMDDSTAETCKELVGHSGPVYAVSFSPDRTFLLSGSEDGAIRLWSMQTWTCLVVYKGHVFPVWDVQFSPLGYYFASCGHDRTARLWTTEQANPLRIFQGHFSDIDCLAFHPNSNYVGTGSSDRSLRLWDCVTGACVRFMTGHKASVLIMAFSPDGRFIASGSSDKKVLIWDIAFGHLVAELEYHTDVISGLGFSREGTILASSALDCTLALWDFGKLLTENGSDEMNVAQNPEVRNDTDNLLLGSYRTKSSPVLHLHFTRRNLLLAIGSFEPT